MPNDIYDKKIEFLKGVGPAKATLLAAELNITSCQDIIKYFPFRYIDRSFITQISSISQSDSFVQIAGKFSSIEKISKFHNSRLEATFSDLSASIKLMWFRNFDWIIEKINPNTKYLVFGRVSFFNNKPYIAHPEILTSEQFEKLPFYGKFQPVYFTTEKLKEKGIDSKAISNLAAQAIEFLEGHHIDSLPQKLRSSLHLPDISFAYKNVHFPSDLTSLDRSLKRFRFEEALILQLKHRMSLGKRRQEKSGIRFSSVGNLFNNFYHQALGFQLTNAQKNVMREIRSDLGSGHRMNRLLQGDVGSGKTVVAMMAALLAADNGYQSCLMAPTEILAQQHYATFINWSTKTGFRVSLLTGSTKPAQRKQILDDLSKGHLHIIIGTHALIEDPVVFHNLGLAIIDEQHRFGVMQRAKLNAKGKEPVHVLVMSATPIPRTLAMTFYGDLDVSIINELPPGRKQIKTLYYDNNQRLHAINLIKKQIDSGRQCYVVYPLIKESEKLDLVALEAGYEALIRDFKMPQYEVGMLHGRMNQDEKEFVMKRFIKGLTNILVSTTVIEVGVDVPNASVMIIENVERFGLSQLHQLRGRVGRGNFQSFCVLIGGNNISEDAKTRIQAMLETQDGFKIAEADLKLRGPGDIMGTRQSGDMEFRYIDLTRDEKIISTARDIADKVVTEDPELSKPEHQLLKEAMNTHFRISDISSIA